MKPTLREPACRLAAFAWIVGEAKHTPEDGLKRGEIRLSERRLAEVMCWPRPRAQRFLKWLVERSMLRSVERSTQGTVFVVVSYRKFQDPKNERSTERSGERSNTKNKKKGRRFNGVAETPKSEGGDAVLTEGPVTKKKPAAKKALSLDAQRAFLAAEIRKGEADA